jgi:hypothetical protein
VARSDRGVTKEARELADRVNALDGYEATIVQGGGHAGLAYIVRREGEYVARFSGHASVGGLALVRAEAELRRRGVPLPRKDVTPKKEILMPAPTKDEKRLSDALRPRVAAVLESMGGDTTENRTALSKRAAEIVGRGDGENFGGSSAASAPHEIAAASLKKFLEGGALKMVNLERWTAVERELAAGGGSNGDRADAGEWAIDASATGGGGRGLEGGGSGRAGTVPAADEGALREERELRQVAESALEDAERERDEARRGREEAERLAEARESARASLVEQVEGERRRADEAQARLNEEVEALTFQRGRADRAEAELERARARAEELAVQAEAADPDAERKHDAQVRGYKGRIGSEQKRREEAEAALAETELKLVEREGQLQEARDLLDAADQRVRAVEREAAEAQALAARLEREAASPAAEARAFLFRELEAAQGAPRPWLLERLDGMLLFDG